MVPAEGIEPSPSLVLSKVPLPDWAKRAIWYRLRDSNPSLYAF